MGTLFLATNLTTMPHVKTAIAVPEDLLAEVDRAARARGESRSKYITRVLRAAVRARRDVTTTEAGKPSIPVGIEGYGFTGGETPGTGKQGELLI